jgi:hypothetical protein
MNWIKAIVLGLIQGFTEFLPVHSSGHLELGKYLFGINAETNFYFSIAVHRAIVLSTVFALWKVIADLSRGFFHFHWNSIHNFCCHPVNHTCCQTKGKTDRVCRFFYYRDCTGCCHYSCHLPLRCNNCHRYDAWK